MWRRRRGKMDLSEVREKVAFVTGAASGIGRATALRLTEEGWGSIARVDRDGALLGELASEIERLGGRAIQLAAHLNDLDRVSSLVDETVSALGRIDAVVNCAAAARPAIAVTDYDT